MRLVLAAALTLVAAPAVADEPTTLQYVTTRSVVMKVGGMEIAVTYKPDGTFTAMDGAVTGSWKIVGDTMCSTNSADPTEVCIAYPAGKKPGDEFELMSLQGPFIIKINP